MDQKNKKPLLILRDEDIFPDPLDSHSVIYDHVRVAVKAILLNEEGKIALVGTENRLLPGGGVEEGESLTDAMKRECLEECGYEIKIVRELGTTEEYRAGRKGKQETHCFVARIISGDGIPRTTQADEQNFVVEWFSVDEAIEKLKHDMRSLSFKRYNTHFNLRTHLVFLEKFKKESAAKS